MAHITGGGLTRKYRRVVPDNLVVNFYNFEYGDIFQQVARNWKCPR